jgi:short-subunit dehydrogenase involved in D-alanine esterification of teichoic acids
MELSANTVLITGGSSPIGYAMASSTRAARSLSAPAASSG